MSTYDELFGILLTRRSLTLELEGSIPAMRIGLTRALATYNEEMKLITGDSRTEKGHISISGLESGAVLVELRHNPVVVWKILA